jgi:hypothetical protein
MKIPVNKNPNCENIEGLVQYESDFVKRLRDETHKDLDLFDTFSESMREQYCGGMCKCRYHCAIAERYMH